MRAHDDAAVEAAAAAAAAAAVAVAVGGEELLERLGGEGGREARSIRVDGGREEGGDRPHLERVDVEVVRRLVEDEQVRPRGEHVEKLQPPLLAAAERADPRAARARVAELELLEQRARVALDVGGARGRRGGRARRVLGRARDAAGGNR